MANEIVLPAAVHTPETAAEECSDATAEKYDRALTAVQRLLKVRGARSYVVHTHCLKLFGDGRPFPLGTLKRYTPELVVHSDAGGVIAVVTMGPLAGVRRDRALPRVGVDARRSRGHP